MQRPFFFTIFSFYLFFNSYSLWATIAGEAEFIDRMTKANLDSIELSNQAVGKTENKEVKKIAQKLISRQEKEIAQMKKYNEKWYSEVNVPQNGQTFLDKSRLNGLDGKEFDKTYIDLITKQQKANLELMGKMMPNIDKRAIHHLALKMVKKQGQDVSRLEKIGKDL
jgi:uncharacterized protein (DUF305 family)